MPFPYQNQCLTIVVVGASGDLAKKKTYPSLFELYCQDYLPKQGSLSIVGYARSAYTDDSFREKMRVAIGERGDRSKIEGFLGCCRYQRGETYDDIEAWVQLNLRQQTVEDTVLANRLFTSAIHRSSLLQVPVPLPKQPNLAVDGIVLLLKSHLEWIYKARTSWQGIWLPY